MFANNAVINHISRSYGHWATTAIQRNQRTVWHTEGQIRRYKRENLMQFTPLTKTALKANIKAITELQDNISIQQEIDPVSKAPNLTFDHYCGAFITTLTNSITANTKDRLDALETDYNSLLTTIGTLGNNLIAVGVTMGSTLIPPNPIGLAFNNAGVAVNVGIATQNTHKIARDTAKTTQDDIEPPYIDGKTSVDDAEISKLINNIFPNTLNRLNTLEVDYNLLMVTLTTLAVNLAAIPVTASVGTAMSADMTVQATHQAARLVTKTEQDALQTPYLDGVK